MAWTTPVTHVTGDVVTAADWNGLANDLSFLGGSTGLQVTTTETTTTLTYVDLTTAGPAVTVTTGTKAIVSVSATLKNGTAADGALMSYAVSGATTIAAGDGTAARVDNGAAIVQGFLSSTYVSIPTLTAGSNTFTSKYRAGTGGTATFAFRTITVIPLP